jgi:DNA helicase-2/ATP-dependent DNA helicase PcrA
VATTGLEKEVINIFKEIDKGNNFLLSGGAGSGKTYSLISVINEILLRSPNSRIACITYTNAAATEIRNRITSENLVVSTIHDFLWGNISSFQTSLKETLLEAINEEIIKLSVVLPYSNDFSEGIKYKEHLRIENGEISHDEVIILAKLMYQKYKKLCDILKDKFNYILVDEYQDTSPYVIELLLDHLNKSDKKNIIGFFGDSMQSIYDNSVCNLDEYISSNKVIEITKKHNRRNPQSVINLSNLLRRDSLKQEPSNDKTAPNMKDGIIKLGSIKYLYGSEVELSELKSKSFFSNWDFSDSKKCKDLRLTHNLISKEVEFSDLTDIYDKDPILKFIKDLKKHLKESGEVHDENKTLKNILESINGRKKGKTYLENFLEKEGNQELYDEIKDNLFSEIRKIYFDKDNILSDKKESDEEITIPSKRDKLIKHLFKINDIITTYKNNDINEFIKKTSFKIKNNSDKKNIQKKVDLLNSMSENLISEVIEYADKSGLCIKDDNIKDFIKNKNYLYNRVSKVKYQQFINLYNYLEGNIALSTQHKVKGSEFDNVLIFLDNGKWSKYNFEYLFDCTNPNVRKTVLERTNKLFYVCCTRAKENLVVVQKNPTGKMIETAKEWFGKENCHNLGT